MRFGITIPITGVAGDLHKAVEYACLAEKAGWDGAFIEDYICYAGQFKAPVFDPWILMAAVAARTKKIRLGITVTPLARRRPWKVAKEAATLDHLSGGRLILGIGLGDTGDVPGGDLSFRAFGEQSDPKIRAAMLDEALDVLLGLWTGRPFSFSGKHYQVKDVTMLPVPVQKPRIPIWAGGGWPRKGVVARAARCDGACFYKVTDKGMAMTGPEDVRAIRARFPVPFDIVVGGNTPGDKPAKARAQVTPMAEAGATWWSEWGGASKPAALLKRIKQGPPRL